LTDPFDRKAIIEWEGDGRMEEWREVEWEGVMVKKRF
jgi:hypothetical protein